MRETAIRPQKASGEAAGRPDAIVTGAGVGGLYALHHLRDRMVERATLVAVMIERLRRPA